MGEQVEKSPEPRKYPLYLRGIVTEPHKSCGTDFRDLASLDHLWNTPPWDIKNGILKKIFLRSGGLAQLIFRILLKPMKLTSHGTFAYYN